MPSSKAWSYNFNQYPSAALPRNDWNVDAGTKDNYNNEQQAYTPRTQNVRIENGTLVLEAQSEKFDGKDYTSGRIDTKNKFNFTYGTLEMDMMLPKGSGTWPAAWLLPQKNIYNPRDYGIASSDQYAWALNGEIDFEEGIGSIPGQNIPAAHSYNEVHQAATYTPGNISDPYTSFHRYGVIKTPNQITFTIDGQPYATRTKTSNNPLDWPYNQPYYLIIDLAMGGNWAGTQGIDNSTAPWQLKVRSISYQPM